MSIIKETATSIHVFSEKLQSMALAVRVKLYIDDKSGFPILEFEVNSVRRDFKKFSNFLQSLGILAAEKRLWADRHDLFFYTVTVDILESIDELRCGNYLNEADHATLVRKFKEMTRQKLGKKSDEKSRYKEITAIPQFVAFTAYLTEAEVYLNAIKQLLHMKCPFKLKIGPIQTFLRVNNGKSILAELENNRSSFSFADRRTLFQLRKKFKLLTAELEAIACFTRLKRHKIKESLPPAVEQPLASKDRSTGAANLLEIWIKSPLRSARKNLFSLSYEAFFLHYTLHPLCLERHLIRIEQTAWREGTLNLLSEQLKWAKIEVDNFYILCEMMRHLSFLQQGKKDINYLLDRIRPAPAVRADVGTKPQGTPIAQQIRMAGGSPLMSLRQLSENHNFSVTVDDESIVFPEIDEPLNDNPRGFAW